MGKLLKQAKAHNMETLGKKNGKEIPRREAK